MPGDAAGPAASKAAVRRFLKEVVTAGHRDCAAGFVTADYVEHQELPGGEGCQGIEMATGFLALMRGAFPDFRFEVGDLIAEGNRVAAASP